MFNFIQNIDILVVEKIYRFQHNLNSELFNRIMIFFTNLGDHGTVWIAIALILLLNKKYRKTGILAFVSLAICSLAVNIILKPLIQRPRPFTEIADIIMLIKTPKDYSFPSGHTAASFVMVYIFFKHIKKYFIPVFITGILIAFSRMYLSVHYPSDILAGLIIGTFSGLAGEKAVNRFTQKRLTDKKISI